MGGRPLGTNPIAFAFPRGLHNEPFVFDLSTSVVARGEIELHRRASITLPPDWAIDEAGVPTTDPVAALRGAILPFGGHKGAALGLMLLAGPLIGDLRSASALQVDTGDGGPLRGGYLMLAIDPAHFGDGNANIAEADQWLASLADDHRPARLPGSRRLAHRVTARAEGIRIPAELYEAIRNVSG